MKEDFKQEDNNVKEDYVLEQTVILPNQSN